MSTNFNSWNAWANQREIKNRSSKIRFLVRKVTLSVLVIMTVQCTTNGQLWVPEVFSMGWKTEQKIWETNQWSKLEARENTPVFEDEFVSAKIVSIGEQRNKLVINLKTIPNAETIITRSNFIQFSKIYNNALEASGIIERVYDWKDIKIKILNTDSFEEVAKNSFKKSDFSLWNMIYMLLLQNYIQTKMFNDPYSMVIMHAEDYNKECWKNPSISDCSNHSIIIKEGELVSTLDPKSKKKLKSEHSKSLISIFSWFEKQVLWVPTDNVYVEFKLWTENLKHALNNGFSFWIYKLPAEKFREIVMKTLISWSKQIFLKIFHVLKTDSKIDYVLINYPNKLWPTQ